MTIPKPTELRISTHTATCNINSSINVELISNKLEIGNGIVYIEHGGIHKGNNPKNLSKKAKNKKKMFFNQITIIVEPKPNRLNNVKLFNNGAVSMTGLKEFDEGKISMNIIIELIKNITGVIFRDIDNTKDIDSNNLYCSECNNKCSLFTLNKIKCEHYVCNMCKTDITTCNKCNTNLQENAVINNSICKIKDYDIVLINSDFYLGFEINRSKLHNLLCDKYNIFSTFEPCIYPGVNSKYFWNKDYLDKEYMGKCYCDIYCNGKGKGNGNGDCKKITISMFQSGSIIITGARNMDQINLSYKFINKIFADNYELLKKNELNLISNDSSNKKKIVKIKRNNILNYPTNEDILKLTLS
jgi:TATA-box binding protein (TBP) (component of TFIID and TFIIIB)